MPSGIWKSNDCRSEVRHIYMLILINAHSFITLSGRVFYIRCHNLLVCIGVSRFVNGCKWLGFGISLILTLGHIIEHIHDGNMEDMVYYEYFLNRKTTVTETPSYFDYIASMACLASNLVEFLFFIIIISELYRLHQIRANDRPNLARRHAKKNVITAMGHFVSWVVEILVFGAITLIVYSLDLQEDTLSQIAGIFFILIPSINYTIFPTIQVLTSQDLRLHVFGRLKCKCFRERQGGAGVEEIELNVLGNGDVPHQDTESAPNQESAPDPGSTPDPESAPLPGVLNLVSASLPGVLNPESAFLPGVLNPESASLPGVLNPESASLPGVLNPESAFLPGVLHPESSSLPGVLNPESAPDPESALPRSLPLSPPLPWSPPLPQRPRSAC